MKEERKKVTVDVAGLAEFLYTAEELPALKKMLNRPPYDYDFNSFNKSRVDLIKESMATLDKVQPWNRKDNFTLEYLTHAVLQLPYTIHTTMFVKCIEMMGTEAQQEDWFKKAV